MSKRSALYIIGATITILLLILFGIYFGTVLVVQNSSTAYIFTQTSEKPILHGHENICNHNIGDFNLMIESIASGLGFFSSELVADSGAGARILQAQLQIMLQNFSVPTKVRAQLQQLLRNATDVGDRIVIHIKGKTQKEHLKQALDWIENESMWEMPAAGDWQDIDALDMKRYNVPDNNYIVYSGTNFSDTCIAAVFDDCNVPEECFSSFLRRRYSEYLITHSLLFLLAAKKRKCFDVKSYAEKLNKFGDPNDIIASLCAKIHRESQSIAGSGFDYEKRDLFSEQVFVCAMAGFKQFLRPSWLRSILSWQRQDPLGCFPLPNDVAEMWKETYEDGGVLDIKRQNNYGMKKAHKCAPHFTTVAISYIAVYLRYILEFCSDTLFDVDVRN